MRIATTLAAAAAISAFGVAAQAGNPEPAMDEPMVDPIIVDEPRGSSVNSTWIIIGVLAVLVAAAAAND